MNSFEQVDIKELNFSKGNGLIPVVTQDYETKDILMLAYVNKEALEKTIETGLAHYWSRSRGKIWLKGETSGNYQKIIEIRVDCDNDSIIYIVKPLGPACHTGNFSCFYRRLKKE
jgi:phosphoribosyl-AMP cyclohydrolase